MEAGTLREIADIAAETVRALDQDAYETYSDADRLGKYTAAHAFRVFADRLRHAAENSGE